MILRFKTLDNRHYMNINTVSERYNFDYYSDKHYIKVEDRAYSDILGEINFNCWDYLDEVI